MASLLSTRWDPFTDLPLLRGMMPRMDWSMKPLLEMKLNVYEKGDMLVVEADLPGVAMKDVKVTVQDYVLTIRATRDEDKEIKDDHYYVRETMKGEQVRSLRLPPTVDTSKIDAAHKDGCLTIRIPKMDGKKLRNPMDVAVHEA